MEIHLQGKNGNGTSISGILNDWLSSSTSKYRMAVGTASITGSRSSRRKKPQTGTRRDGGKLGISRIRLSYSLSDGFRPDTRALGLVMLPRSSVRPQVELLEQVVCGAR